MKHFTIVLFTFIFFMSCNDPTSTQTEPKVEVTNTKAIAADATKEATGESSKENRNNTQYNQDDWYWKNTQMSRDNRFENWEQGVVDLVMTYRYKNNATSPETIKVGSIESDGTIKVHLPETIQTETKVSNISNLVFYDIQDMTTLRSHNPETGYFGKTTMQVVKNGAVIGNLTLGNSVRVTYNLTNQSTLTMGDEGYLVSWVYVDGAASTKGTEETKTQFVEKVRTPSKLKIKLYIT